MKNTDHSIPKILTDLDPEFGWQKAVAIMDGKCTLCTVGARMIDRFDKRKRIFICPVQTELGHAVLSYYGQSPTDPKSWLFIADGKCWTSFEAWIKVAEHCGGIGRLMSIFWLLPKSARNWLYRIIADNRIRLFGRSDLCALPSESLQKRLIGSS